jgi:hypothetical protein
MWKRPIAGSPVGVRHLGADMYGQMLASGVPDRTATARLHRNVGLPVLHEPRLDHTMHRGELSVRCTGAEALVRHQIVGQRLVN